MDDDCLLCVAQGCPRLRRLALRHCSAVTDAALMAVSNRCKGLQVGGSAWAGVGLGRPRSWLPGRDTEVPRRCGGGGPCNQAAGPENG